MEELEYRPEKAAGARQATRQAAKKPKKPPVQQPTTPENKQKVNHRVVPANLQPQKQMSTLAVDIAEGIYQREIELMIRKVAESTLKEEMAAKLKYQKPIYESIYEPMLSKMIKDIAREVIEDYQRKIQLLQNHEIKKVAREQIVNNLMLEHMLDSVAQQTKSADEDDQVTKLLDSK